MDRKSTNSNITETGKKTADSKSQENGIRQKESLIDKVKGTMKSTEAEGTFEVYFNRLPGYLWASLFKILGFHPVAVTLISMVLGAAAGYCFYFDSLKINLLGILLLLIANQLDCADGQLARMTGKKSLAGRILDGFAGDVWFLSIYVFMCLRLMPLEAPWANLLGIHANLQGATLRDIFSRDIISWLTGGRGNWGIWIWVLCICAGRFHARQSSLGDYYRNIHMWMSGGRYGTELDESCKLIEEQRSKKSSRNLLERIYSFFYIRYTRSQEGMTPEFQKLFWLIRGKYDGIAPKAIREEYRKESNKIVELTNILTFDARSAVLYISVLIGQPWIYPVVELTVFQGIKIYMHRRYSEICDTLIRKILKS